MLKDKQLTNYMMLTPVAIFKVESEKDYDGFENYCGYHIQYNRFLPSALEEEKYNNLRTDCEYEDDSYCMLKRKKCEHKRRVGYIQTGEYERVYPLIGQYVVTDGNKAFVVTEEQLQSRFILTEKENKDA